jgi:hypothetical protein
MTFALPTDLYLSVVRTSATMSLHVEESTLRSSESFALVLRASYDTNVILSTGQRLADVDIHLTLFTKHRTANELDQDLKTDDVGFLAHTEGEYGAPFVHGAALLFNTTVVALLLSNDIRGKVIMGLPTVPFNDSKDTPYVWGQNRPNMLRMSYLEISALRGDGAQSDG